VTHSRSLQGLGATMRVPSAWTERRAMPQRCPVRSGLGHFATKKPCRARACARLLRPWQRTRGPSACHSSRHYVQDGYTCFRWFAARARCRIAPTVFLLGPDMPLCYVGRTLGFGKEPSPLICQECYCPHQGKRLLPRRSSRASSQGEPRIAHRRAGSPARTRSVGSAPC
jgi:hypothetical protein